MLSDGAIAVRWWCTGGCDQQSTIVGPPLTTFGDKVGRLVGWGLTALSHKHGDIAPLRPPKVT